MRSRWLRALRDNDQIRIDTPHWRKIPGHLLLEHDGRLHCLYPPQHYFRFITAILILAIIESSQAFNLGLP